MVLPLLLNIQMDFLQILSLLFAASIKLASIQTTFHYLGPDCSNHVTIENPHPKNFVHHYCRDLDNRCHMVELRIRKRLSFQFCYFFVVGLRDSRGLEAQMVLLDCGNYCFIALIHPFNTAQHPNKAQK